MPLVVPDLSSDSSSGDGKTAKWTNQLLGKKIGDNNNETTFAQSSLPKDHRIVRGDSVLTADYKPDRLNIHTDDDGTVHKITHG